MAITLAHLSDLHFGMKNQAEVWRLLVDHLATRVKPQLVLVTGDLADSAQTNELEAAGQGLKMLRTLGIKCYVCAGNHDRHMQGNAARGALKKFTDPVVSIYTKMVSPKANEPTAVGGAIDATRFDYLFNQLGMLAPIGSALDIALPSEEDARWRIRLLALDSSMEAKYAAQGFVTPAMLSTIRQAAAVHGSDEKAPDLVIVLIHHHLLPVSSLEAPDRQTVSGFFASTILLNAGTVLETLAGVGADLVLHGHEHSRHLARYGAMISGRGDLTVIGAASATGAHTHAGCQIEDSSFNVIQLGDDLSVTLFEQRYRNGTWEAASPGRPLMGAVDIRRARYLRKQSPSSPLPSSRVLKQFTYTASRNAVIREIATNCLIERQTFRVETENSSGTPYFMGGFVEMPTGNTIELQPSDLPMRQKNGVFEHEQLLDGLNRDRAVVRRIEHEIAWLAGGVLTQEDLSRCGYRGDIRDEGREFVEMHVRQSLESLTLAIELPQGLGPATRTDVEVLVRRPKSDETTSRPELTERLRFSGLNRIAVNIPFPLAGYSYLVAWRLPEVASFDPTLGDLYSRMAMLAREAAFDIVANLAKLAPGPKFSVGVYIPESSAKGLGFRLAGHSDDGLPGQVTLHSNDHPFCRAYWGVPKVVTAASPGMPTLEEQAYGLLGLEAGMIVLPLPTFQGGVGTAPGIARIAWPVQDAGKEVDKLLLRAAAAVQGCASRLFDLAR